MGQYERRLKRGKRFYFSGQYLGQKYFSRAIYLSKKEARDAEREKINELDKQARNPKKTVLLLDLANERLDLIKATKSKRYYRDTRDYLKVLTGKFGNLDIAQITRKEITEILLAASKNLRDRRRGNYRVNAMIRAYKALWNFAIVQYDLDLRNPVPH